VRRRYVWTFMLCWVVLGNVVAGLAFSAGPVFFQPLLHDPRFAELTGYLDRTNVPWLTNYRQVLWNAYISNGAGLGTGISAFPSLHVSMATLFFLLGWEVDRRSAWFLAPFAVVTILASIHLGWHYAIDGYAAAAGTGAIWLAVGWALRAREALAPHHLAAAE
jgi:membrane-associated phospholipid phosphatase